MSDWTKLDGFVILSCYFVGLGGSFVLGICVGILRFAC